MRCPDCNKFVSLETGEPEEQRCDIYHEDADNFRIEAEFRLPRNCGECGQELKEANFTFDFPIELKGVSEKERNDLSVEIVDCDVNESGGGRYAKNVFSLSAQFRVATTEREIDDSISADSDEISAGAFDELV